MKSSTLHRSNLTKERMDLLREIKAQRQASGDTTPGIYVRPSKEKELDMLWQSFKVNPKNEKSVNLYMIVGFVGGALAMFLLTALISFATHVFSDDSMTFRSRESAKVIPLEKLTNKKASKSDVNFLPPDKPVTENAVKPQSSTSEQYTIQSGDTLDKIAIRFYGKYDSNAINKIAKVNNISNPHQISIGQVITIPMN